MHYMIVYWLKEELTWKILHHSHDGHDARRMFGIYCERYGKGNVVLMIDIAHAMVDTLQQMKPKHTSTPHLPDDDDIELQGGSF